MASKHIIIPQICILLILFISHIIDYYYGVDIIYMPIKMMLIEIFFLYMAIYICIIMNNEKKLILKHKMAECMICQETTMSYILQCYHTHTICELCFDKWLIINPKCPICRAPIN